MFFKLPGHSGMGQPRGVLEELQGFVGSLWHSPDRGCRPSGAFARASCFSLLPVLKVKAAIVEGLGKNDVKRVDWLKRRLLSTACTSGILL